MGGKVTDPALLGKLGGGTSGTKKVTDPGLLSKLHGDAYLHPEDMTPEPGLALPGMYPENHGSPNLTFGTSSSDTLNPLPAISAFGDAAIGNVPVMGPRLQQWRDEANAAIHGDSPADARADMNRMKEANPGAVQAGAIAGRAAPYLAAAGIGGPIAGALGLEGPLGLRLLFGGLSSEATNIADRNARGEPLTPGMIGNATKDTLAELPFYMLGSKGAKSAAAREAPTVADLKAQATPLYQAAEKSGVVFSQPSVKHWIDSTSAKAMSKGLDETLTPKSVAVVKRLQQLGTNNMSIADAMTVREVIGNAAIKTLGGSSKDHAMAVRILHDFDAFLEGATKSGPGGLKNMAVLMGDAKAAHDALRQANKLWSMAHKGETLDKALEIAIANHMGKDTSLEKAIRSEFSSLEKDIISGDLVGFSPKEIALIKQVAHGSGGQKVARMIGKLKSGGVGGIMNAAQMGGWAGFALGGLAGAPVGAALGGGLATASGLAGKAGRSTANALAKENAEFASAGVRNALGSLPAGKSLSAGPVLKSLPGTVGRAVTTMTLGQWAQQQQALPAH